MSDEPVLRPEEVAGVLSGTEEASGAATATAGAASTEPQPYSLREPVAMTPEDESQARDTLERIVAILDESIRAAAGDGIQFGLDGMQQQRSTAALSTLPDPVWVASLSRAGGGGLALAFHPGVALALVDASLGGGGEFPEKGREPTELESRVMGQLLESTAGAVGEQLAESFQVEPFRLGDLPASVAAPGETVAVGLLRCHVGEGDHASLLLATPSLLLPSRRRSKSKRRRPPGPLRPTLDRVSLAVHPVLRAGRVCLNDLLALEPGKVLRLDAPESTLLELRASGQTIARGRVERRESGPVFAVGPPRPGPPSPQVDPEDGEKQEQQKEKSE